MMNDEEFFDDNDLIKIRYTSDRGRCVYSNRFIPRGTVVYTGSPYVASIDHKYKRNICSTCFKYFSENCRQNVIVCGGCGEDYYCSSYCKQFQKAETRHSELECEWLQYFSKHYKAQLLEDDKNILLIMLKVLARRINENQSLDFSGPRERSSFIPSDVNDLIDHLDDYLKSFDSSSDEALNLSEQETKDRKYFRVIWKKDLRKLTSLSRIVQNILDSSKCNDILDFGKDGSDGDLLMTNNDDDDDTVESLSLTKIDYNILRLLCKIRSNYFGLWHNGLQNNLINYNNYEEEEEDLTKPPPSEEEEEESLESKFKKSYLRNIEFLWCGSAVYLSLSLFNHSCFPNCTTILEYNNGENGVFHFNYSKTPLSFSIVTLFDINPGEELLITYIPLNQPRKDRISQLKSTWLFECNCKRCEGELVKPKEMDDLFNGICCPIKSCSSGILYPISDSTGICRVCKSEFNFPQCNPSQIQ